MTNLALTRSNIFAISFSILLLIVSSSMTTSAQTAGTSVVREPATGQYKLKSVPLKFEILFPSSPTKDKDTACGDDDESPVGIGYSTENDDGTFYILAIGIDRFETCEGFSEDELDPENLMDFMQDAFAKEFNKDDGITLKSEGTLTLPGLVGRKQGIFVSTTKLGEVRYLVSKHTFYIMMGINVSGDLRPLNAFFSSLRID